MELEWFETNLILALRVFRPIFTKYGFYIRALELNSVDGEYITASGLYSSYNITIVLTPGFDVSIAKKKYNIYEKGYKGISLGKEKDQYPEFSSLGRKFKNEEELIELLKGYALLLETHFSHILLEGRRQPKNI